MEAGIYIEESNQSPCPCDFWQLVVNSGEGLPTPHLHLKVDFQHLTSTFSSLKSLKWNLVVQRTYLNLLHELGGVCKVSLESLNISFRRDARSSFSLFVVMYSVSSCAARLRKLSSHSSFVSGLMGESETMTPRPLEVCGGVLTAALESLSHIQSLSPRPFEVCGEENSISLRLLFLHDRPSDVFCLVGRYRNPKALTHPTDRNDPRGLRLKPWTRTYPKPTRKCAVAYPL